jgi:hypothetical protein
MKGQAKQLIQHYEALLAICDRKSREHPDPEVRQAFNVFADAYGYLIMCVEKWA